MNTIKAVRDEIKLTGSGAEKPEEENPEEPEEPGVEDFPEDSAEDIIEPEVVEEPEY